MPNSTTLLRTSATILAVTGCILSVMVLYGAYKQYSNIPSDVLVDPWETRVAMRMLIAFAIAAFGAIIKGKVGLFVSLSACLFILGEYVYWYYYSYQVFHNPYVGSDALVNKAGLVEASWGHILLLLIALLLTFVLVYSKCRNQGDFRRETAE